MSWDEPTPDARTPSELLSAALRAIRRERRLRTREVARAMEMPLRSYEHFEAGKGPLSLDRLIRFADATDSDPFAILASLIIRRPEFALRAADNKLMTVFMLALEDFNADLKDDIAFIEARVLVGAFRRVFQDLAEHVRKRDLTAEIWLQDKSRKIGLPLSLTRGRRGS